VTRLRDELERREIGKPDGLSRFLLDFIHSEGLAGKAVLDVGCGWGRLALALAHDARRVLGVDRDREAIARARKLAEERALTNVEFRVEDAEAIDYRTLGVFDMVVANLCVSDAIIERSSLVLGPGRCFAFACFHTDQWKETGKVSPFAYDRPRLEAVLDRNKFRVERMEIERDVVEFVSKEEALWATEGLKPKWEADGRWANYAVYLERGGRQLTRSHLIVKARKQ
jgi:SAM-dependent methyltransferase